MTDEQKTGPKTVAEAWEEFRRDVVESAMGQVDARKHGLTYHAGMKTGLYLALRTVAAPESTFESAKVTLQSFAKEIDAFIHAAKPEEFTADVCIYTADSATGIISPGCVDKESDEPKAAKYCMLCGKPMHVMELTNAKPN